MLSTHVRKTCAQFGKRICSWDVVNEAVHQVTGEMRDTVLSRAIGTPDQVVELAFRTAREQLPDTELVYNDYMGWEKDEAPHRDGVLRLLERLRATTCRSMRSASRRTSAQATRTAMPIASSTRAMNAPGASS